MEELAMKATEQMQTKRAHEHVLDRLYQAEVAVEWLVKNKFTVLSVEVSGRNPIIWIANSSANTRLSGVMVIRQSSERGIERVIAAIVEGCQVQWRECGH